jgi:hypothetical protein
MIKRYKGPHCDINRQDGIFRDKQYLLNQFAQKYEHFSPNAGVRQMFPSDAHLFPDNEFPLEYWYFIVEGKKMWGLDLLFQAGWSHFKPMWEVNKEKQKVHLSLLNKIILWIRGKNER